LNLSEERLNNCSFELKESTKTLSASGIKDKEVLKFSRVLDASVLVLWELNIFEASLPASLAAFIISFFESSS
jgi:hypothetical protein